MATPALAPDNPDDDITRLLAGMKAGEERYRSLFMERVYAELKRIAGAQMKGERAAHTLQASALVNEAYIRLMGRADASWENRAHFFATAASTMRRILIDHARAKRSKKRDGGLQRVDLDAELFVADYINSTRLLALDSSLTELAKFDERQAKVVELRYFGGLSNDEAAATLGVSSRTVKREWQMARAWLLERLDGAGS